MTTTMATCWGGLRALGVRYLIVQTDPALADAEKGSAPTLRAVRGQPEQIVMTRDFGGVTVFELSPSDDPPPASPPERPAIRGGLSGTASHNPGELVYAFDEDFGTRWLSNQPQRGNEEILIHLDQPTDVSHLRLTAGRSSHRDYPRHLVIDSTADGRTWNTLYSGSSFERLPARRPPRGPLLLHGLPASPQHVASSSACARPAARRRSIGRFTNWSCGKGSDYCPARDGASQRAVGRRSADVAPPLGEVISHGVQSRSSGTNDPEAGCHRWCYVDEIPE